MKALHYNATFDFRFLLKLHFRYLYRISVSTVRRIFLSIPVARVPDFPSNLLLLLVVVVPSVGLTVEKVELEMLIPS